MSAYEVIQHKQQGLANTAEEIRFMVAGALDGRVEAPQLSAWFMAIYFRGMSPEETWVLTRAMLESGRVLDMSFADSPVIDKHSTGGVGDKVTFVLGPLWAACGLRVPTITGRGLGHTGGTVDKLESIPGIELGQSQQDMARILARTGLCILRQTEDLVPADRLFYALRDVTATVESVPLICGSILSKKLAEGLDCLVLDVKCGSGAIFQRMEQARELAESLVAICRAGGKPALALITAMDVPLGRQVGNWNELVECVECLQGHGPADLMDVTLALGVAGLLKLGLCDNAEEALLRLRAVIDDGSAFRCLVDTVAAQGGQTDWLLNLHHAPRPRSGITVTAPRAGVITGLDARAIGRIAVDLGAGRQRREDPVDPLAGLTLNRKPGDRVRTGDALCDLFVGPAGVDLQALANRAAAAYTIGDTELPAGHDERLLACIDAPFSPEQWRSLRDRVGLGLRPHPLWAL
jgi:pyrimidine-nucleoside phosphorylase